MNSLQLTVLSTAYKIEGPVASKLLYSEDCCYGASGIKRHIHVSLSGTIYLISAYIFTSTSQNPVYSAGDQPIKTQTSLPCESTCQ